MKLDAAVNCVGKACHVWGDGIVTYEQGKVVLIVGYDSNKSVKHDMPFIGADHRRYGFAIPITAEMIKEY